MFSVLTAISHIVVVDVSIAQGTTGHSVTADTDGGHRASQAEKIVQHGLSDTRVLRINVKGEKKSNEIQVRK